MFTLAGDLSSLFLAAMMMGNHANCSQFAASNRLDWLVDRLEESQQSSTGTPPLTRSRSLLLNNHCWIPRLSRDGSCIQTQVLLLYSISHLFTSISFHCIRGAYYLMASQWPFRKIILYTVEGLGLVLRIVLSYFYCCLSTACVFHASSLKFMWSSRILEYKTLFSKSVYCISV